MMKLMAVHRGKKDENGRRKAACVGAADGAQSASGAAPSFCARWRLFSRCFPKPRGKAAAQKRAARKTGGSKGKPSANDERYDEISAGGAKAATALRIRGERCPESSAAACNCGDVPQQGGGVHAAICRRNPPTAGTDNEPKYYVATRSATDSAA